ncbi:hypothetical protein [Rhodococcus erythropolis]|uniref:Uncharacterized protein n=1 Tax=Rhodococcus erythropolis TaxID=1833 RepID=A0A8I0ZZU2_RHOER|nr:hypothetical protein [Rhodococcus erythropolis]MBH5146318.1 hypothetical protein [Rhodococcus erythropolis]
MNDDNRKQRRLEHLTELGFTPTGDDSTWWNRCPHCPPNAIAIQQGPQGMAAHTKALHPEVNQL